MSEIHLRKPNFLGKPGKHKFSYSTCGPLTKNKERIQNLKKHEMEDIFIKVN